MASSNMKTNNRFPTPDFFQSLLCQPFASISYTAHKSLAEKSGRNVIQCSDPFFDVHQFAAAGHCEVTLSDHIFSEIDHQWDPIRTACDDDDVCDWNPTSVRGIERAGAVEDWDKLGENAKVAWYDIKWPAESDSKQHLQLELVTMKVPVPQGCPKKLTFLLSDSHEIGSKFIVSVEKFVSELQHRIWVFEEGSWSASTEMYKAVAAVSFGNLVLTADKGAAVKQDMELFFKSRKLYEDFGLPWKRGYLLTGPPGNGKTHLVKALINHITSVHPQVAPLYVKSFSASWSSSDHYGISEVFKRARKRACILVLEDLDTLITDENRAVFLNELDGFHTNHGVVVVATTNHPDKLDPALRDRLGLVVINCTNSVC